MYEYVIFLKKDSAIDILQETFHVLNKKKKFLWEIVFNISNKFSMIVSITYITSFYQKMNDLKNT